MNDPTATVSQLIDCTPQQAFDAFVDPSTITRFWLESTSAPLREGSSANWTFRVPGAVDTVTVLEFEPPRLMAFSWSDGSATRLEFAPHSPGRTRVSVEFGYSAADSVGRIVSTAEGFSIVLCDLKTLLETGHSARLVEAKAELIASGLQRPGDAPT